MGYYTTFSLKVIGHTEIDHEEEISNEFHDGYPVFDESVKWYDYQQDMKEYSLKYPELLFKLEGVGEQNEDMWICYFKNGKMQECPATITFDDFDESKLV